jgi:Phage major capsid protein E
VAATYVFPSSEELTAIAQEKLPTLTMDDPIFKHFPIQQKNMINLRWEQMDDYTGLQQLRGVGGEPQRVKRVNAKSYSFEPGVYGEYLVIDEKELLERRPMGTWDGFVPINDLVMAAQDQLMNRQIDRLRWILWTLLVNGAFFVNLPTGAIGHGDQYANVTALGQFGVQTAVATLGWVNFATATPLQDLRSIGLLARGRSVDLGNTATCYINRKMFFNLVRNTNLNDFGGKKAFNMTFSSLTSLSDVNKVLIDADVPQIAIYDQGYIDDTNTFQLFIPDGTALVVGSRTNGDPLGAYYLTRNIVNVDTGPGMYMKIIDWGVGDHPRISRSIEVHSGHSGGPVLYYPSSIVRLTGI